MVGGDGGSGMRLMSVSRAARTSEGWARAEGPNADG